MTRPMSFHALLLWGLSLGLGPALVIAQESPPPPSPDASPLDLADLEAYRAALAESADAPAVDVPFEAIWSKPDEFRGDRIRVEGRLARRFRQGPVGVFPALTEAWISTPNGNVICLVYTTPPEENDPPLGSNVQFSGRYLKRVRYEGGDQARLAPLIVSGAPPEPLAIAEQPLGDWSVIRAPFGRLDWIIGGIAAGLVVLLLIGQVLRKPPRRHLARLERLPPPEFLENDAPAYNLPGSGTTDPSNGPSSPFDAAGKPPRPDEPEGRRADSQ